MSDLQTLIPQAMELVVKGEQLAILPLKVGQMPAFLRAVSPMLQHLTASDIDWLTLLMADDLAHLPFAVGLSRRTRAIILQNVFVSLGVVAFLVPATIFGLGIGPAVAMHEGSTLLVVFNALRLLAYRDRTGEQS